MMKMEKGLKGITKQEWTFAEWWVMGKIDGFILRCQFALF